MPIELIILLYTCMYINYGQLTYEEGLEID